MDRGHGPRMSYLAGIMALTPCTQHIVLDKLVAVLLHTELIRPNWDLHLLQVVGLGQRHCGKKSCEPLVLRGQTVTGHVL